MTTRTHAEFLLELMLVYGREGSLKKARAEMRGDTYFMMSEDNDYIAAHAGYDTYIITDKGIEKIQQELGHERTE